MDLASLSRLSRPFRLLVFDWEGTAVDSRRDDAATVRGPVERLLRSGVQVVVVTGADLDNIEGQFSGAICGPHKRNLYLATNLGSEVYGFDGRSRPHLLWRRTATQEEGRLLTEVADAVRDEIVARTGLDVRVIYDRMDRRKVDLLPEERWRDPPKSLLPDLLATVQARLRGAGLVGGLEEVLRLARRIAEERGLKARLASEVQHVEIGLADKSDPVAWAVREIARPRGVPAAAVLIGGDEFGPVAGLPGSDALMMIPETRGAVVVSVGPEPAGVPPGVLHIGGGPARFRELLARQAALHPVRLAAAATTDASWTVVEEGFTLAREHEVESLFALGNGHVGSRGSLAEGSALSAPATFVAGVFDPTPGGVPGLRRLPDWSHLATAVDGTPIRLESGETLEHRRTLDLRQGVLWRDWRHRDPAGRVTRLQEMRFVSADDRRLLVQSVAVTPENYSGALTVEATVPLVAGPANAVSAACATVARVEDPEGALGGLADLRDAPAVLSVELGRTCRIDRAASIWTSRETESPAETARKHARCAVQDLGGAYEAHRRAWSRRWDASDIRLEGDPAAQLALRFAAYHLLSAVDPADGHVSIGARGLTGAAYKGHVFWDTEIFMLPFFILTYPRAARALLMYRHHTLPAARARASQFGYRGALYAWESADTGEDVTPGFVLAPDGEVIRIFAGTHEHHVSAAVAFGAWSYWTATGDESFLLEAGAEILLETARFWASRAVRGDDGRLHIREVVGPDEYHEPVDDNAYTNGMARWNLETGAEVARLVAARWPERWRALAIRLGLGPEEPESWMGSAQALYTGLDERTGLIEQFQGYFGLEEIDLAAFTPRSAPMDVLLGRERVQRSTIVKQPDVIMLLYLLWDRFSPEVHEANFRFYERRCAHGSSLSPSIHALLAARLGDLPLAERYFEQAMRIDLHDTMGNAAGGIHAGALGGLWQAAVFGFGGLRLTGAGPEAHPRLPQRWRSLSFEVQWRGRPHAIVAPAAFQAREAKA